MVKNHCLAKSINDAGWYQFRVWLEYFGKVFKRITIAVNPAYTSQECSNCGVVVKKSLSTRTHACQCGCVLDRDHNAGINILNSGLGTAGHVGTSMLAESCRLGCLDAHNLPETDRSMRRSPDMAKTQADIGIAQGDSSSTVIGANL